MSDENVEINNEINNLKNKIQNYENEITDMKKRIICLENIKRQKCKHAKIIDRTFIEDRTTYYCEICNIYF